MNRYPGGETARVFECPKRKKKFCFWGTYLLKKKKKHVMIGENWEVCENEEVVAMDVDASAMCG